MKRVAKYLLVIGVVLGALAAQRSMATDASRPHPQACCGTLASDEDEPTQ